MGNSPCASISARADKKRRWRMTDNTDKNGPYTDNQTIQTNQIDQARLFSVV